MQKAIEEQISKGVSFGACTEGEVLLGGFITENIPWVEKIRMVNSGTEAVMSTIRLARGFTGRDKIIKFSGCYHGHSDSLLVKAGSGAATFSISGSSGVLDVVAEQTLLADYNDLEQLREIFSREKNSIACVILEPVAANMGLVLPKEGFLQGVRELCDEFGALLIFDEVITGFRLGFTGAAGYYNISPDLVTYGKIIGGGMPVGAFGGRKEIMDQLAPLGPVYQAGTLSGNPVAMAAGLATLKELYENPEIYEKLEKLGRSLKEGLEEITNFSVVQIASLLCIFHQEEKVNNYQDALKSDTDSFGKVFHKLIEEGIYTGPSQFEVLFLNNSFTEEDINQTLEAYRVALQEK